MTYNKSSEWNEINELRCLIIFKQLEKDGFPRGKQFEYCKDMAEITKLEVGNISAKVSNYKSEAGINKHSNTSKNTEKLYKKYKLKSIEEIERIIREKPDIPLDCEVAVQKSNNQQNHL